MGRTNGVAESDLRALAAGTFEAFAPVEQAALRYALAMTQTQVDVSDACFAQLRAHLDDRQIVELTAAIAWENYRARFNHALGMEAEGFSEGAFCPIPSRPELLPSREGGAATPVC